MDNRIPAVLNQQRRPYMNSMVLKELVKIFASKCGVEIRRKRSASSSFRFISLNSNNQSKGDVLLSYLLDPFLASENDSLFDNHTQYWECLQMARTFTDLGYTVDVINSLSPPDEKFVGAKKYSFYVDTYKNIDTIAPLLDKECIRIYHITRAHWLFNNAAESKRCLELQQRKAVTIKPRRQVQPYFGIELANYGITVGNEFTISTYAYANKPIYRIPITTSAEYPWPESKDYGACRRNFLWLGGRGAVHKGLDLVLDVFRGMPDYNLIVCGDIRKEDDFETAYFRELYETRNIKTLGWIDVRSGDFSRVIGSCVGIINPSCAEGCSGSVIQGMHAGLIPVVSRESGVDVDDFGIVLKESSISEIKSSVVEISSLHETELKSMSRKAWEFARANHTRERFAEEYRKVIAAIISQQQGGQKLIR